MQRIVEDLAAQRYGEATSRYRTEEDLVLSPEAAPSWRRALEHEDPTVREWAVDALSRIGEPDDVEHLVRALDDPFRGVQEAAAAGLTRVDPQRAVAAFRDRLHADDPIAVTVAAQSLAELADADSVPLLLEVLGAGDVDASVRGVVAQSLGQMGDPRAAEPLADLALDRDEGVQLRRNAAEALAMIEGREAEAAMERLLAADDEYIVDVARRVLGR